MQWIFYIQYPWTAALLCLLSIGSRHFWLHCWKRCHGRKKGNSQQRLRDMNRFNISLEHSEQILHAMSDSYFFSSISADLKSDINIMRSVVHTNYLRYSILGCLLFLHMNQKFYIFNVLQCFTSMSGSSFFLFDGATPEAASLNQWCFSRDYRDLFLSSKPVHNLIICLIHSSVSLIYDQKQIQPEPVH